MFLSLGSTSRSSNSAAALFGGHGQGQGSSDWEQFDRGRAFERLPRQQQQNETEIDPLQALAGGKYSSLQRRQHHHFQNSPRPFHQVQTSSPFDIQVPNIDGTPPMIPFPLSSAILPSTFGQLQLPSTSFSTSTTTNSGGGCSYLQPSPSLPSSSLQPSLSRDSHGSVFGNGGEEVLSARINEQGTGAAVGGKRTSVALLLAKQVKEKLGINKLREVVQHDAVSGAGINKNNKNISNNNNNSVLLQQRSSSPGCSPGLSISPWEWEHADHDRNFGLTKDDISAMAPSPSPNRRPNNVHASRLCSTSSLSSVGDRGFDVKETVLGAKNLESLADEGGRSLSGSMESSLGSELERSTSLLRSGSYPTKMFMIKNVTKYLFGDTSKEAIIEIPQGQLYIVRPLSPKGYSELIYKDAVATIRRTGQEFQYQLVIQRAYEEGEEELADEEDGEGADALDTDERTFLLDRELHFRSQQRESGEHVLAWRDLSGDVGDLYEFVCDPSIQAEKVSTFHLAAVECQYERKYKKTSQNATEAELEEFSFDDEDAIPTASSVPSLIDPPPSSKQSADQMAKEVKKSKKGAKVSATRTIASVPTTAPAAKSAPTGGEILTKHAAELHMFEFESGTFILQDASVVATVMDLGKWQYWLQITGSGGKDWLGQEVVADINPVFNFEYLSFIFNHYTDDGSAFSWLLRFRDQETLENFQEGLMRALWEQLNEVKWSKIQDQEREYVLDTFNDLTMEDAPEVEEEEEEEEEEENAQSEGQQSEHYDSDESADDVELHDKDGNVNSQLAVGSKHDRSFVVRGSKIGVFKHLPNKHLEFSTNISKIETPKGRLFSPKKVMLHAEDQNLVLQDETNPNSLYRMDLEYGKIVDEWKVHDDIGVVNFAPESKFAQQTAAQPFIGHSRNALFRIDPRIAGNKLVESQLKQYMSKNDFSAAATTEKGHIAVASNKGDVRLFDRIGVNAKTHIPALGEAITGLDVSADGRWLLATCRTYLLLVDTLQKDGKNEGKLGFEKSFAKDSKPQPRRLGLTPSHVAQFQHETGAPLAFTTAKFNTGLDAQETSIITSTGPFLVTWNLKKVLAGNKEPYQIKRYSAEVKADNFEFGSDKNVILALPNEVDMVNKKTFKKPTRESIAGPAARISGGFSTPRKSGRASHLRNEIVNSPY